MIITQKNNVLDKLNICNNVTLSFFLFLKYDILNNIYLIKFIIIQKFVDFIQLHIRTFK